MNIQKKERIHLWIYNHPFSGISDQVDFFVLSLKQRGYSVTIGKQPRVDALNVVIENFSNETAEKLVNFCSTHNKKVAVIMTEHIDFINNTLYMHGEKLWTHNDYMHPYTQVARLRALMSCSQYIRAFFVLGDLPMLKNFSSFFVGIPVLNIPFPTLEYFSKKGHCSNDATFTGFLTEYRNDILHVLRRQHNVSCPTVSKFLSRAKRGHLYEESKIILNLPQREEWKWLSLMRIIAALRHGRATVSIGTNDSSKIAECVYQIPFDSNLNKTMDDYLSNWKTYYDNAYANYHKMAETFEEEHPFPEELFDYWALLEGAHT